MTESVQSYIASVTDERRQLFDRLQALILGLYPEAEIMLSYGVPSYKLPTGRVHLGYWKHGVSVYPGSGPIPAFQAACPTIKTSKGTISLKLNDAIPTEALTAAIRAAVEGPNAGMTAGKGDD
ncbi:MAG: DUF1801 domain-containing protein [Caldilineales bacterium]|nr:DUF1801 domain-containing protein [Caldilineales bacterium]MCW5858129.1 DUF1801 domain-containing protein [Caldilineales bacterium]